MGLIRVELFLDISHYFLDLCVRENFILFLHSNKITSFAKSMFLNLWLTFFWVSKLCFHNRYTIVTIDLKTPLAGKKIQIFYFRILYIVKAHVEL